VKAVSADPRRVKSGRSTKATRSDHIDAAPETVFDHIVDPTIVPPGMRVQTVHESPEGVGSVYEWTYRLLGIPFRGITVYTQYVPNRRFVCQNLGMVAATVLFTVEPEDGGTRLTREMGFKVRIPLLGRLLEALMVKAAEPDAVRTVACPRLVDFFTRRGVERLSR
jgi:carbon monoxide dehydrogenase subunit G